ncbi:IS481 family transposase [Longimicrobium terrae]|uniref:IS481 family transposase n=1 Tax=Longimicrobium terrae TaxID=1639882 RepID=UPI0014739394|nr:IS481 family transposase [Longimicrobium terrae]NNC29448.1 IS481 family transposase [Longimicrobium terrae]
MNVRLHKNATTTPRVRAAIQQAPASESQESLALRFGVHVNTIRKWRRRTTVEDGSHTPHKLHTTLSPELEQVVVELRRTLLLSPDDLLVVVRQFIAPTMSRSALDRLLRRHGVSRLQDLMPAPEAEPEKPKRFKSYEPGFIHVDVKYLPRMKDEEKRKYLYVAIDRATRWVYHEVLPDKSSRSAAGFLARLVENCPLRITKVLTDNGSEFSDRFVHGRERTPTGRHAFDKVCAANAIEHRLSPPWHPQTNGMVERYNGRISEQLARTRFASEDELRAGLDEYLKVYLGHIPQRALGHKTPRDAMLDWYQKSPGLFRADPHNHPGLDR